MPEKNKKFHELALKSVLFKGRHEVYFCYLKSEKIAHVLFALRERSGPSKTSSFDELTHLAAGLPQTIVHFAGGEVDLAIVLADLFSLLSAIRIAVTQSLISKENGQILAAEYEQLVQKLSEGIQPSPFLSTDDFSVSALPLEDIFPSSMPALKGFETAPRTIKDIKGHSSDKGHSPSVEGRASLILSLVRKHKSMSIKDISAVVRDCSEKTIQRELLALINQGFVRKQGDRRWSVYLPV